MWEEVYNAIYKGNTAIAINLIDEINKEEISNQRTSANITLLHLAARYNNTEVVQALISKMTKKDLALVNVLEETALHVATGFGYTEIAKILISAMNPEDLLISDAKGNTALHYSAAWGDEEVIEMLKSYMSQEQIAIAGNAGNTALNYAIFGGHTGTAKKLLVSMLDTQLAIANEKGETALHFAVTYGDADITKELTIRMSQEQIATVNNHGTTALHYAVSDLYGATIGHNIVSPESNKSFNPGGASSEGGVRTAKILIACMSQEQLAIKNKKGKIALHEALFWSEADVVLELINKMDTKDLTIYNEKGDTLLHIAINKGYKEIAKALIVKMSSEQLASVNASGQTPLQCAILKGDVELTDLLGTNMKKESKKVVELGAMQEAFAIELHSAIGAGKPEIAKELLEGVSADQFLEIAYKGAQGKTLLHLAITKNYLEVAKILASKMTEKSLTDTDSFNQTALHYAISKGDLELIELLVDRMDPVTINIFNQAGRTALHQALSLRETIVNRKEIWSVIIKKCPDSLIVNTKSGISVLKLAENQGNLVSFKEILSELKIIVEISGENIKYSHEEPLESVSVIELAEEEVQPLGLYLHNAENYDLG